MLILESPRPNGRSTLYLSHMPGLTFPVTRHFLYDIASANILARLRPSGMVDWLLRHARRLTWSYPSRPRGLPVFRGQLSHVWIYHSLCLHLYRLKNAGWLVPGVGAVAYLTSVNGEQVEQFAQASSYWRLKFRGKQ